MKMSHKPLMRSRRGRAISRTTKRRRTWDARHAKWTPQQGREDTYIVFRLPLLETEMLSFELHRTWHAIDSEDDDE